MFSETEEKAIKEKIEQLLEIKYGVRLSLDLAASITQKRVNWIKKNKNLVEMLEKYKGLNVIEQAYNIIFFDYMKINPKHLKMSYISENKISIDSYNPCPYLEACKTLELDTKNICKVILEPPINEMIKIINPNLRFTRNYDNIRPYNKDFCEEHIFLKT